jgi:hypothetical protein
MLTRVEGDGVMLISQPAHAWLSGQLARHWGNEKFPGFAPAEEVILAAALHDIGFLGWEESPTLNPASGLPYSFLEMPTRIHLGLWSAGIQQMLHYGRYSALLVSLHFTSLCRGHPSGAAIDRQHEDKFLAAQESLQKGLLNSLRKDPIYEPFSSDECIALNRKLVSLWDWLSLVICTGFQDERVTQAGPASGAPSPVRLRPVDDQASRIAVSPWPFRGDSLSVSCEGRHLLKGYRSEKELREALQAALRITLQIELVPE